MSDDWQVGDLAVCVDAGPRFTVGPHFATGAVTGGVYRVEEVAGPSLAGYQTLILSDIGRKFADRFRKVTPDKHEACETEFVTLLKRSKRKVGA